MNASSIIRRPRDAAMWALAIAATALLGLSDARAEDPLSDIDSVEAFAEIFDADKGAPRIVLLLSPT